MEQDICVDWSPVSKQEWDGYMQRAGYVAYQQHMAYAQTAQQFGAQSLQAVMMRGGQAVGVVQLLVRRALAVKMAIALRGPVWLGDVDDSCKAACYRALKQTMPLRGLRFVLFMPEADEHAALGQAQLKRVMTGHSTVLVDLQQDEEALLAGMDGKWRNRLRAAQKSELVVEPVSCRPASYEWLLAKETEQASRIGYKALATNLVPVYQEYAGEDSLLILQALHEGEVVGGVLMLLHGHSATYHIGWSSELGKKLGAHNLLLWEAMRRLKASGTRWLDLGGVTTDPASAGLARFKLGLCSHLVALPGTYM